MVHYLYLWLFASLSLFGACTGTESAWQVNDLEEAMARWQEVKPASYSVEIERICFCPPPSRYTLFVREAQIEKVIETESGDLIEEAGGYMTIDELFVWLENVASQNPQKLELQFDNTFGYPTLIDYNQSDGIADEEIFMRLQNLKGR